MPSTNDLQWKRTAIDFDEARRMETRAHKLFEALGLVTVRNSKNRYPAASTGPNAEMRYWATEITTTSTIRFGAQMRSSSGTVPTEIAQQMNHWGFIISDNGREIYREISLEGPTSKLEARRIMAVLACN